MPYTINLYNGTQKAVVADGTVDNTLDLKLIGKNYAGYGEIQNENFVFLLENFANTSSPPKPLGGQVWFDSGTSKLKFYDGTKWRTTGGAEVGSVAPAGLTTGDFWYDTSNKQLYAWDSAANEFVLIGPQGVAGSATTQMRSVSVRDNQGTPHAIIEAVTDGDVIFTISPDADFTLDNNVNAITGFTKIYQGVTLAYTNSETVVNGINQKGITQTDTHKFWGTASNADKLGGFSSGDFIRANSAIFNTLVQFADVGFTIGQTPKLRIYNELAGLQATPTIQNIYNDTIAFQTKVGALTVTPLKLVGHDLMPGEDNATDLGSDIYRFKTISAVTFNGLATQSQSLAVGGAYKTASTAAAPDTIAARTSANETINGINVTAGAIKATYFVGTATTANYADLAEKYLADAEYETGTVLSVGGEAEVTACKVGDRALGAVSANPAHLMNSELEGGTVVALKGRIPVKVTGPVVKGQRLVAGSNGTAQAAMGNNADVFAIALETNNEAGIRLVECVIL